MGLARTILLAASTNNWLRERALRTSFVRRSVSRFMPGERIEDAMAAARSQQAAGVGTILTRLGENLTDAGEAETVVRHYLDVLDRIEQSGLDAHISVKPTQLGLDFDQDLCRHNLERLIERAGSRGTTVWIDMESSDYVERTLDLYRSVRSRSTGVGLALQAYLRRTAVDVETLVSLGTAIRLVKGAYLEPAHVAFQKKRDVDRNFFGLASRLLDDHAGRAGVRLHIATHDPVLVRRIETLIAERAVGPDRYEFAMLYGIQRPLQRWLVERGHRVRVLISYGEQWFPWYMRRLAERSANVWFVAKNVFSPRAAEQMCVARASVAPRASRRTLGHLSNP